jgi:hemin uptake protein HemP
MIRRGIGVQSFVAAGGGTSYVGLLDTYTGASAAYSVRLLRGAYSGSAIRVRRSSDNTEQDIGFDVNGNLNESALTTFVGAGNGFVTTWYDQSGNAANATQSTAINQPQIVGSGTVFKQNNKIVLKTDGSSFLINNTLPNRGATSSTFVNLLLTSTRGNVAMMSASNLDQEQFFPSRNTNGTNRYYDVDFTASALPNGFNLISIIQNSGTMNAFENAAQVATNLSCDTGTATGLYLFRRLAGNGLPNGSGFSEVIIYGSNQSSSRTGIESNINTYYGIY